MARLAKPIPNTDIVHETGFAVGRGSIATLEIGTEVKILGTAMIKQINPAAPT
jgi:hypothetical protein